MSRNAAGFDVTKSPEGHEIPYLPEALEREQKGRRVDPIAHCAMPACRGSPTCRFHFRFCSPPDTSCSCTSTCTTSASSKPTPRDHLDGIDLWLGDTVGRWEGDTLVIDVTNLRPETWLDSARHTHSEALHVVERYTRTAPDTITYEATIDDPKT